MMRNIFLWLKILHIYFSVGCDDVCFRSDRDDHRLLLFDDRLFYNDRDSDDDDLLLLGDDHCYDLGHSVVEVLMRSLGEEYLRFVL